MKIATYATKGNPTPRTGLIQNDQIIDLPSCGAPGTMIELLSQGIDNAIKGIDLSGGQATPIADIDLQAPIPNPGKVLAIGLNYADHVAEGGRDLPKHQVWFNKQHNCINGPYADVLLPAVSDRLDYEAELCLVIGKTCKHVPRERAHEVIGGYFCGNDVSVRDWQRRAPTVQIGKSFDTHGPIGPYLVTPDEVGDAHDLDIRCTVNGEERQHSNTKHLIFDCYDAIAHLTQAFTLDIGDVLFMGTPAGVGAAMDPPSWLKEGDRVRVEIEKLGYIENTIVKENAVTLIR